MKVTIKDVARDAGVSIGTVSRVINGKDRVSKETKAKVEASISRLNFHPDETARSMIFKQTKSIGLIVPLLSNEYWSTLAEHVQEAAWERGYTLLLCSAGYELDKNLECFKTLVERKVDGIISGSVIKDAEALHKLYQTHLNRLPLVSLDYTLPTAHYNISADHFQASVQAVTYLIRLGHVRIAYLGSHRSDREAGYRFALESNGLTVDEALIIRGEGTFAFGSQAAAGLLNRELPPTALFCWNDMTALGAMQSLQQAGLAIPADISVIGYDDIPMASLVNPALTSVRQPLKEIGRAAVQALITEIEGQDQASTNRTSILATEFIIRGSTGVNPGRTGHPS